MVHYRDDNEIAKYMHRVRMLVIGAHLNIQRADQERLLLSSFTRGQLDKKLAIHVATVNRTTSSKVDCHDSRRNYRRAEISKAI